MLTDRQVESYRENGFLRIEGVFTASEIDALRRVTDEFVERSRTLPASDGNFVLERDHRPERPRVRRLQNVASLHPLYRQALEHPSLLDLVARLIGPSVRYRADKLNFKLPAAAPGAGGPVAWSQAWVYYPHTNDDIAIVGVALDDTREENGCLQAIPGSHRGPVYDHDRGGAFAGSICDPAFRPSGAVPIQLPAGGISVHHVRVIHGNGPNRTAAPRRVMMFQYCAGDAWPLIGGAAYWPTYAATFLRGRPTRTPRLAAVPARLGVPSGRWGPRPGGYDAGP